MNEQDKQAKPVQPAGAQGPVGQVVKGVMLTPEGSACLCGFGSEEVRRRLANGYKHVYTEPPAVAVNEQMLEALKQMLKNYGPPQTIDFVVDYPDAHPITKARAAIAAAEAAKGGV